MTVLECEGRKRGAYFTADELMKMHFPEPRWAVPGLIAEGLTLLGGAPKQGKSWLCLDLGISVASGTPALGKIDVDTGDVLYAALEDPPRRLHSRLRKILGVSPAPTRLTLVTELPTFEVALDNVAEWLEAHPAARLVIVDVLAKIRPQAPPGRNAYELDYAVLSKMKGLADRYSVAVIVVTHLRKMEASDVFDTVSGSTGLTGAADATIVLKRARGEGAASLHVTGRDVVENEYAVTFDPTTCTWSLDGAELAEAAKRARASKVSTGLGDKSAEIVTLLADHPEGLGPTQVGKFTGMTPANAGTYLTRLADAGRLSKISRGRYTLVESVQTVETGEADVLAFPHIPHIAQGPEGEPS